MLPIAAVLVDQPRVVQGLRTRAVERQRFQVQRQRGIVIAGVAFLDAQIVQFLGTLLRVGRIAHLQPLRLMSERNSRRSAPSARNTPRITEFVILDALSFTPRQCMQK